MTDRIEAYVRSKQISLAKHHADKKKVYLDLNFWIVLREAALGLRNDEDSLELLKCLRSGVAHGRLVCPVSDGFFMELLKQPFSDDRRIGSARIVDDLSLGITLTHSEKRVANEVAALLYTISWPECDIHPTNELIWTKACHILGEAYPTLRDMDASTQFDLQRMYIDYLWERPLVEMVMSIGGSNPPSDHFSGTSASINSQRDLFADDISGFDRALEIEFTGAADLAGEIGAEILWEIFCRKTRASQTRSAESHRLVLNSAKHIILAALKVERLRVLIPTLYIESMLHAAFRVDKPRRFKPNDLYDFHHASAALAYCDVFLTEKPLRSLLSRKQFGLESFSPCKIASDLKDAVRLVREVIA